MLVGAITPCGQCGACLSGQLSQCGHGAGYAAIGGWRFGNTIDGAQAEYLRVPYAQANLARIPDELSDEQVVLLADIASTGFSGAESGGVRLGDAVVVLRAGADRPVRHARRAADGRRAASSASTATRRVSRWRAAWAPTSVLDYRQRGRRSPRCAGSPGGVDVAIEALGTQQTFESALRCLRPGGTLSSLGVYSGKLQLPYDAFAAGLGDHRIVTTLCPGGKERMRRLMELVRQGRIDLTPLLTHRFALDDIAEAYELFGERRDGVLKVAIRP